MNTNFSNNLKSLRESAKLSQSALAKEIGVTRQSISAYENGNIEPSLFILSQLATIFNCSIDSLVFGNIELNLKSISNLINEDIDYFNISSLICKLEDKKNKISLSLNEINNAILILKKLNCDKVEYAEELMPVKSSNNLSKYINTIDLDFYRSKQIRSYNSVSCKNENIVSIPKVGNISAGTPMYACEDIERYFNLSKDDLSYQTDEYFILQVNGESMNKIYKDKDYILVHKTRSLVPNKPMIALVNGEDATMKYVKVTDCNFTLIPHSDEKHFEPITYPTSKYKLDILGEVVGVINEIKEE